MRRLGKALGYEAMAIYKHIPDKEALLDLVVAELFCQIVPPNPNDHWEVRLRHIAGEHRRVAISHPHLFQRMFTQPPAHHAVTAAIEHILAAIGEALASHGATDSIGEKFWLYISTTSGALLAETNAAAASQSFAGLMGASLAECPALVEFGPAIAACDYEQVYLDCIDNLVAVLTKP